MTKFIDPSFSSRPSNKAYRDNYEATFGKKKPKKTKPTAPKTSR